MDLVLEELDSTKDKLLRALAENENTRRQMEKSRTESVKYGVQPLARELLNVVDNFERALPKEISEKKLEKLLKTYSKRLFKKYRFDYRRYKKDKKDGKKIAKAGRNKHPQQKTHAEPASTPEASIISKKLQKQASPAEPASPAEAASLARPAEPTSQVARDQ